MASESAPIIVEWSQSADEYLWHLAHKTSSTTLLLSKHCTICLLEVNRLLETYSSDFETKKLLDRQISGCLLMISGLELTENRLLSIGPSDGSDIDVITSIANAIHSAVKYAFLVAEKISLDAELIEKRAPDLQPYQESSEQLIIALNEYVEQCHDSLYELWGMEVTA